jgi:hypothetical protein
MSRRFPGPGPSEADTGRRLLRLLGGWSLMAGGAAVMLEAGLPSAAWPRSDRFLAVQGCVGFGLLAVGCFLRRAALRGRNPSA